MKISWRSETRLVEEKQMTQPFVRAVEPRSFAKHYIIVQRQYPRVRIRNEIKEDDRKKEARFEVTCAGRCVKKKHNPIDFSLDVLADLSKIHTSSWSISSNLPITWKRAPSPAGYNDKELRVCSSKVWYITLLIYTGSKIDC